MKWIAFWPYVSGGKLGSDEPPVSMFCLLFGISFVRKEQTALTIQCDSKLEICKGNKRITQKMETVMAGCCVQVQCTFSHFK